MLKLKINGQNITKIISLELDNDLEKPVSFLRASLAPSVVFKTGEYVELTFKEKIVFKGTLESFSHEKSPSEEIKEISCRSLTHLLVDCSQEPKSWPKKNSVKNLLQEIITPFGVKLDTEALDKNTKRPFVISAGETVFQSVERLLQPLGMLVTTETGDNLKIFKPQNKAKPLNEEKIISSTYNKDTSCQFHKIVVLGQTKEKPIRKIATDTEIHEKKKLVIYENGTAEQLETIAKWQVRIRKARSETLVLQTTEENIFKLGSLVKYREKEWLLSSININSDSNSGLVSTLGLKNKAAYEV